MIIQFAFLTFNNKEISFYTKAKDNHDLEVLFYSRIYPSVVTVVDLGESLLKKVLLNPVIESDTLIFKGFEVEIDIENLSNNSSEITCHNSLSNSTQKLEPGNNIKTIGLPANRSSSEVYFCITKKGYYDKLIKSKNRNERLDLGKTKLNRLNPQIIDFKLSFYDIETNEKILPEKIITYNHILDSFIITPFFKESIETTLIFPDDQKFLLVKQLHKNYFDSTFRINITKTNYIEKEFGVRRKNEYVKFLVKLPDDNFSKKHPVNPIKIVRLIKITISNLKMRCLCFEKMSIRIKFKLTCHGTLIIQVLILI